MHERQSLAMEAASDPCVVNYASGVARGVATGGILRFMGLPYAAPPVGPNRFALPKPPQAWQGERDATRPGAVAPQAVADPAELEKLLPGIELTPLIGEAMIFGDDFL